MLVREVRKEFVGNGPKEISTRFVGNWAISEMKGNLTNVEKVYDQLGAREANGTRSSYKDGEANL
ncbi:hypothetical protein GCM10020331_082790 [Ectobacillus funiculus]